MRCSFLAPDRFAQEEKWVGFIWWAVLGSSEAAVTKALGSGKSVGDAEDQRRRGTMARVGLRDNWAEN